MRRFFDRLRARRETAAIRALPDRRLMAETFIPVLAETRARILWVGSRAYTAQDYAALEQFGAEVWTTDIDPRAERWGRRGRHRTGDVCEIDQVFPDLRFDAIICNGVLGYGVDTLEMQARSLAAMANVLVEGGVLILGWNTDKIDDPVAAGLTEAMYERTSIGCSASREEFSTVTHVYDCLRRKGPSLKA